MARATFKGGVHPLDAKEFTKDVPTKVVLPKGELVFPMSQHIGAPAKPIVAVGDKVLVGQTIADANGFISASVCSSVSGVVKAVEPRLTVSGSHAEAIIIENDNEYTAVEGLGQLRDYTKMSKEEIRQCVKEAGIVGMGGAGFPTHVKITPKDDSKIDFVIVNAAECEPYLTSDYRMLIEEPEKLVKGLNVVLSLFENAKGLIAIEDNKPEAIEKLKALIEKEDRIELKVLKTKYPQGGERQLIYASTGRKMNSSLLPADIGCIVNNVDTVISIYMAVCESTPLIRRIVTVTGDAVKNPSNFNVKLGTSYRELIEEAGGFVTEPQKIISGGPMMGLALYSLDVPVIKTSSALVCMTQDEAAEFEPSACIRCGRCAKVCPSKVLPQKMYQCAIRSDEEGFVRLNGMECCDCGCCTYACPAKIRLTQAFIQTRRSILASRKKA